MASSSEKTRRRAVSLWGVVVQLRRLYITLLAGETGFTRPTEACCNKRVSGERQMDAFRIHFRVLIAGGLATALLSLPIDTRPARLTAESSPRRLPVAQAEPDGT